MREEFADARKAGREAITGALRHMLVRMRDERIPCDAPHCGARATRIGGGRPNGFRVFCPTHAEAAVLDRRIERQRAGRDHMRQR